MKNAKENQKNKYYVGLDVGTDSIGWAVTDEKYELLRNRGQDFWGVYLFDEALPADNRRAFRSARRRVARTRQRINLLQELFAEEISKVDEGFFYRLEDSKLLREDKRVPGKYGIFNDECFNDKEYHRQYPTIYHLRAAFLDPTTAKSITDVRLLYLAIHHIVKNRGHFLFEGQEIAANDTDHVKNALIKINVCLSDAELGELVLENTDKALETLGDRTIGKQEKERRLKEIFQVRRKSEAEAIKAIVGKTFSVKTLFDYEEDSEGKKLCFDDADLSEDELRGSLAEDEFLLVEQLKTVYDWAVLNEILGGASFLSYAMVDKYHAHKKDLKVFKDYVTEHCPEKKKEIFHSVNSKLANYAAYVGLCGKKRFGKVSKEKFYKYLDGLNITDEAILKKIEEGTFLQKQRTNANSVVPYQVHRAELRKILENASENFGFLKESDGRYTVAEKIEMLLTFRIPYYVGPLNDAHAKNGFAWVKKYPGTERLKITPWNFDDIVDRDASETEFIGRMTNKCTYLVGENVLPKASILYQEYTFLNDLNNLTFRGKRLDEKGRKAVYDLALADKKVTFRKIGKKLEELGYIEKGEGKRENFGGIQGDFKSSMSSYVFMSGVFGENYDRETCETIITWFTVMSDKSRIAERMHRELHLSEDMVKRLKDFNCSGWGRYSKKLLAELYEVDQNGEVLSENAGGRSIIEAMRETGKNFNELLANSYGYKRAIDAYNGIDDTEVTYKTVEELYCSPSVKRAIWRTVCLVKEVSKIQGTPPARIFVEVSRGSDPKEKGKQVPSRKKQISDLYQSIRNESRDWIREIEGTADHKFSSDKLVLYYMQQGRSAYSGKPISLSQVFDTTIVDIDHIYPQSQIKDDSLDNRVLCFKDENQAKRNVYPIADEIRAKMADTWKVWRNQKLISERKYDRLMRNTPLTVEERSDFISRQLVETRQSTKEIIGLLQKLYPSTEVVYSKAKKVADFKNLDEIKLKKVREVNDFHHAKDAYLNIVVGNTYYCKYTRNPLNFFRTHTDAECSEKDLFSREVKGAWDPSDQVRIRKIAQKDTCRVVRFTSTGKGKLFDATIQPKGKNDKLVPLKAHGAIKDTAKYGGYNKAATAYFSLVLSEGKKHEKKLSIEAIPIWINCFGKEKTEEFLVTNAELKNPRIVFEPIKLNSLLYLNGTYVWLRGKTGNRIVLCNANELVIDVDSYNYLKNISKYLERNNELKKKGKSASIDSSDKITAEQNLAVYRLFCDKLSQKPYAILPGIGGQLVFLREKEDLFRERSVEEQCAILFEILSLFQCNSKTSNFSGLDGVAYAGACSRSKFIDPNEKVRIIMQSPTGYYRSVIDLVEYFEK